MNARKKYLMIVVAVVVVAAFVGINGCKKSSDAEAKTVLCTKCGQIKATDLCCKPDQPKCSACSLAKGSPGCCKLPKL